VPVAVTVKVTEAPSVTVLGWGGSETPGATSTMVKVTVAVKLLPLGGLFFQPVIWLS